MLLIFYPRHYSFSTKNLKLKVNHLKNLIHDLYNKYNLFIYINKLDKLDIKALIINFRRFLSMRCIPRNHLSPVSPILYNYTATSTFLHILAKCCLHSHCLLHVGHRFAYFSHSPKSKPKDKKQQ